MSYELDPVVGQWYREIDKEMSFRVVSIDEDEDLIELQYEDGEADELDSEEWFEMDLERSEAPEDWKDPSEDEDDEDDERDAGWDEDEDEDEDDDWDDEDDDDGDDEGYDDR
jgi:hypothetical protein